MLKRTLLIGTLIEIYKTRVRTNSDLRPETVKARLGAVKRVLKTWPALPDLAPEEVTTDEVFAWAARFKREGTQFRPPGARTLRRGNSATSVNSAIDVLRDIFDLALERGLVRDNPVSGKRRTGGGRLKMRIAKKALVLPGHAQLEALFVAMERNGSVGGGGAEAADFCRFLTMSGARVGEVKATTWGHVDWIRRVLRIPGFKSESSDRLIPLFAELDQLLHKIQARRRSAARFRSGGRIGLDHDDTIFRIGECQRTIDAACRRNGLSRLTHHDFRHIFATTCIECGVDVPTVSRWLGHADGGVLAMKTYGHLRLEHSLRVAREVRFGPPSG